MLQVLNRRIWLTTVALHQGKAENRRRRFGVDRERFAQTGFRLSEPPSVAQKIGESRASVDVLRVEGDRRAQLGLRLLRAAELEQRFAEEKMARGVRVEVHGGARELFGTFEVALAEVQLCKRR